MSIEPDDRLTQLPGDGQNPEVDQLLREAKAAIKIGDKVSARSKLQELVALDQYNEQGWYWLASVVETDDERRVCLGNAIVINPNNAKAKALLDKLSGNPNAGLLLGETFDEKRTTLIPDAPAALKSPRMLIIGGVAVGAIALLVIFFIFGGRGTPPTPTLQTTTDANLEPSSIAAAQTSEPSTAIPVTSTASITIAAEAPTLPPTWTPEIQPTAPGGQGGVIPSPPDTLGLYGRLTAVSGSLITARGNMPVITLDPYGLDIRQISGSEVGNDAILTPDGVRIIYARFVGSTNSQQLRVMNANGTEPRDLSKLWGNKPPLADVRYPTIAPNAPLLAFAASNITQNDASPDIYLVPTDSLFMLTSGMLEPPAPQIFNDEFSQTPTPLPTPINPPAPMELPPVELRQLTDRNSGVNSWPAFAPNSYQIAYVSDTRTMGVDSVDIYAIDINSMSLQNITNDHLTLIEGAPDYSPDNLMVAFHAAPNGQKNNDIYIVNADGSNPQKLTDGVGDNIRPHWSPDGRFIAFSSDRNGRWAIYIIEVATKTLYQVTRLHSPTICTGWY